MSVLNLGLFSNFCFEGREYPYVIMFFFFKLQWDSITLYRHSSNNLAFQMKNFP